VADEGENIPFIVEQRQDEERELDEVINVDSSDDDEDMRMGKQRLQSCCRR
jgi:transcriptional accessory protein Tex/SPT6